MLVSSVWGCFTLLYKCVFVGDPVRFVACDCLLLVVDMSCLAYLVFFQVGLLLFDADC